MTASTGKGLKTKIREIFHSSGQHLIANRLAIYTVLLEYFAGEKPL